MRTRFSRDESLAMLNQTLTNINFPSGLAMTRQHHDLLELVILVDQALS